MNPLTLDSARLPTLATNCVIIGHGQKADLVWTKADFVALCQVMLNENEPDFFMIPYRQDDGTACFAKAKKPRAHKHAAWAWDTITGKATKPASIGFYPRNSEGKSRWAAMDFDGSDGHGNGDDERARNQALRAFQLLLRHPELFLVLCTSGSGGWHLFIFTREFHPVDTWMKLLKQAAEIIGATIRKGECEIFPSDTRGRVGYGIRAPGVWNPKHDTFSLVVAAPNLASILSLTTPSPLEIKGRERDTSLSSRSKLYVETGDLTYRKEKGLYRGEFDEWRGLFAIISPRTRHDRLAKMAGHAFRQVSREVARGNAEAQYQEAKTTPQTALGDHLKEFDELWRGSEAEWMAELGKHERMKFDALRTENDRAAFRIIRNFARLAEDGSDFKIVAEHLAHRIGATLQTACNIRVRLCAAGILEQTADYVPRKLAARFKWIADVEQPF